MAVMAQTDTISLENFAKEFQVTQPSLEKAMNEKNFSEMNKIFDKQMNIFNRLSKENQESFTNVKVNILYNYACLYSLQKQKKKALQAFEECVKLGFSDYRHLLEDTDLDNIRNEKKFKEIIQSLKEKNDYVYMLQQAGKYEKVDTAGLPPFVYEPVENAKIQFVKKKFNLDSIAGNGDEISKILNLLHWVHNNIRHDGNNSALAEFDAIDLYNYHKATGKGINCRQLSITLNEMYLALGIKSRFITCLPKSKTDPDCHVINSVYSETLDKWIWIDPTNNAYVKDENGNFLSIAEVRERLIDGRPLVLNEDANWNNEEKQTAEHYLYNYMAKNLYWLQCPARSIFNVESPYRNNGEKYISLKPSGFVLPLETKSGYKDMDNRNIVTSDPDYFWQKPE
jgi:hypothetical protein